MLNLSSVRLRRRESVSLGRFQNCNQSGMNDFRRHGVEDESGSTISRKRPTIRPSNKCSPTSMPRRRCSLAPRSLWSSNSDQLDFTTVRRSDDTLPLDFRLLEIDQKTDGPAGDSQIGETLRSVLAGEPIYTFQLDDQHVFDEEICKVLSGRVAFVGDCE